MTDEVKTRRRAVNKSDRIGFGSHNTKLQLSELDAAKFKDQHLHWFNDQDGRIERALQAGYTFVDPKDVPSLGVSGLHQENTDLNSKVSKVVSKSAKSSQPIRAYLMGINKEWYQEDQLEKEKVNQKVDQALRPTEQGGQSIESGYTPS